MLVVWVIRVFSLSIEGVDALELVSFTGVYWFPWHLWLLKVLEVVLGMFL